jgi:group I intron endonuclease
MEQLGYIYKIINDINDKIYVGETTRSLEDRFSEHCFEKRSTSRIHKAIQEFGWQHFKIIEIERVPLSQIYDREAYWVQYYNAYEKGYNSTPNGQWMSSPRGTRWYDSIHVIEPNIYFDSAEAMAREIHKLTSWSFRFCNDKIKKSLKEDKDFLGFHLEYAKISQDEVSSVEDRENWIKTLNVQFAGKRIYCEKLNKEFDTIGEAAKFLLDNGYYVGNSKIPIQSIVTTINRQLKEPKAELSSISGDLFFEQLPGSTKNKGSQNPWQNQRVHCNELDMDFDSQTEAACYMIEKGYWGGIKLKTGKLRLSDIINGIFPNYKGYSFKRIE